jgi:hypothetical protein
MKRILFLASIAVVCMAAHAQDELTTTISGDVVSEYVWRGQKLGDVSLQPTLGIAYKGLSLTAWGSVGLSEANDTKELDLTLSYSSKGFNIGITDYWFNDGPEPGNRYFRYGSHATNHLFEACIGYDFGVAAIGWYTNFAGNDGKNNGGHRAYSSYFELSAPFKMLTLDWKAAVGFVPYATSFYETGGFTVTNVSLTATKDFLICKKYHLPVFIGLTANPHAEKMYILCGASFTL